MTDIQTTYPPLLRASQVIEIAVEFGLTRRAARSLVEASDGNPPILPRRQISGKRAHYERDTLLKQFAPQPTLQPR